MSHAKNTEPHLESSICGFLREPLAFWQFHRAAGTAEASRVWPIRDIDPAVRRQRFQAVADFLTR